MKDIRDRLMVLIGEFDLRQKVAKLALSPRIRSRVYRKLASLSRTGMPLPKALDAIWQVASLAGKKPEAPLAAVVEVWRRKVCDGFSFGEALTAWVPAQEWMVIEAGAGDLAVALEEAAQLIDAGRKMKSAVYTALGYPTFLAAILCVLLWIFSSDAIPAFAEVKPMETWTGLAASMGLLSNLVRAGLLPFLLLCVAALTATLFSLPRWTGEARTRLDVVPPWSFYRLVMGTSFLTSLGAFLRAGMPVPEALRRLSISANPWLRERLEATLYYVNSGHDLGEALHRAGYGFPAREIVEDLRIYASLGTLDEALPRIAGEWVHHSLDNLRAFGDAMKVVGMASVAFTIAWVQLGIIAIQQQLTSGL